MSRIFLKWFAGMIPRQGEQHLKASKIAETGLFWEPPQQRDEQLAPQQVHATEAENCRLYSGELRPLNRPALAHAFARPGDRDFYAPTVEDPSYPPDQPVEPPECIAPTITQQPTFTDYQINDVAAYSVISDGTTPLSYQWFFNGIVIPGEVGPAITFIVDETNVRNTIRVAVANACGFEWSTEIQVSQTG